MVRVTPSARRTRRGRRLGLSAVLAAVVVALSVGVFASVASADDQSDASDEVSASSVLPTSSANNPLSDKCGLDIVLVVDRSGSTEHFDQDYKDASKAFVNALVGTPSNIGLVTFSTSASVVSGYKSVSANDNGLQSTIDGLPVPSGLTNWQDALEKTTSGFTDPAVGPDLVVFITDGNPTTHNGSGSDLGNAITAANALKAVGPNHPHITGVAVGEDIDTGNIAKITGAGAGLGGLDPDVHQSDTSTLVNDVKSLALELCGGTVTVHKQVRTGPSTIDSSTPGLVDGWNYAASTGPSGATGDDGTGVVNLDFSSDQLGASTITESGGLVGYSIESATCNGQDAKQSATTFGVTVGKLDVISCTVVNTPALGSITVNKVTTHGAGGPFTVNVSGPNSTNSDLTGSTAAKDSSTSLGSVSSLYPGDYTIDETAMPAGWAFAGVTCSDGTTDGDVVHVHVDAGENVVCTYTNDLVPVDLTITKTASEGANSGTAQALDYTLSVDNTGPADAHVDATVVDMLPKGATLVSVDPPAGVTCDTSALPKITCTIPADQLEVSDPAVKIGISVKVANGSGTVTNKSLVTSPDDPAPCTVTSNDITCTEPTDNYSQVSNAIPAVAAAEVVAPGPQVAAAEAQALAFTGSSGTSELVWLAGSLMLVGFAALVVSSRKRQGRMTE